MYYVKGLWVIVYSHMAQTVGWGSLYQRVCACKTAGTQDYKSECQRMGWIVPFSGHCTCFLSPSLPLFLSPPHPSIKLYICLNLICSLFIVLNGVTPYLKFVWYGQHLLRVQPTSHTTDNFLFLSFFSSVPSRSEWSEWEPNPSFCKAEVCL